MWILDILEKERNPKNSKKKQNIYASIKKLKWSQSLDLLHFLKKIPPMSL
jgi:hypothetical protein